jgi:hypothetical protein
MITDRQVEAAAKVIFLKWASAFRCGGAGWKWEDQGETRQSQWCDTARAALEAAEAEAWRPISDAPRDGTRVLLWEPTYAEVGWFDTEPQFDLPPEGCWFTGLHMTHPTHFRPLPASPKETDDAT